jgi:hypothetical protein
LKTDPDIAATRSAMAGVYRDLRRISPAAARRFRNDYNALRDMIAAKFAHDLYHSSAPDGVGGLQALFDGS